MPSPEVKLVDAVPLPYLLALPPSPIEEPPPRPVLCFLHGYDEAAPVPIRRGVTRHGPLSPQSAPAARRDFIVVAPQLPTAGDHWHRYAGVVREIVQHVQATHRRDPARTYLTGFSFGGNGVFDLALRQRDFWTALWAVDPTRVPAEDSQRPVWLSSGAVSRRGKARFIERMRLAPLEETPPGRRVYLDQGHDHVGTATAAYRDERIYRWLLTHESSSA